MKLLPPIEVDGETVYSSHTDEEIEKQYEKYHECVDTIFVEVPEKYTTSQVVALIEKACEAAYEANKLFDDNRHYFIFIILRGKEIEITSLYNWDYIPAVVSCAETAGYVQGYLCAAFSM